MEKRKRTLDGSVSGIKIAIRDVVDEITQEDIEKSIKWSGYEIAWDAATRTKLDTLLSSNPSIKSMAAGISSISGVPSDHVMATMKSGFIMGMSVIIELLNKTEKTEENTLHPMPIKEGPDTIQ